MSKKHRDLPIRQFPHPPFPSFSWVMTAQRNPPSPAYAYGYIRNVRAQSQARPRPRAHKSTYLPARRSLPPRLRDCPPSHPRPRYSTKPPPSPTMAKTGSILSSGEHSSDKFMETVDYRQHDPPSRPCVPWLEGYTLPRRGARTTTRRQQVTYEDDPHELVFPLAPHVSAAEPATVSSAGARIPKCAISGSSAGGSDDARPKKPKKRAMTGKTAETRAGTGVDVVKINRLDIVLGALRRACGLSAKEEPCKPSPSS